MLEETMLYDLDAKVYNHSRKIKCISLIVIGTGLITTVVGFVGFLIGDKEESKGIECIGD